MILREMTIKQFGYDPIDLKEKSIRKVWAICEKCNIGRIVKFQQYRNLCFNCSRNKGNKHWNYGKHWSNEVKDKNSKSHLGKPAWNKGKTSKDDDRILSGKDASNWKGGFDTLRPYLTPKGQCIKLNSYFKDSHFHHIMSGVGIYIPKDIHNNIYHSIKNNKNMNIINNLSFNYLIGGDI